MNSFFHQVDRLYLVGGSTEHCGSGCGPDHGDWTSYGHDLVVAETPEIAVEKVLGSGRDRADTPKELTAGSDVPLEKRIEILNEVLQRLFFQEHIAIYLFLNLLNKIKILMLKVLLFLITKTILFYLSPLQKDTYLQEYHP